MLLILLGFNLILLAIWFHQGLILGGGDTGLPFYNPSLVVSITQFAWWGAQGTGFSYPGILSSLPLYSLLAIFQHIGFNPLALQILFFGGILIFSTWGMFAFTKRIANSTLIAFFVTIFYLINPFSMINIWHRGAYNSALMLVILPWTMYFIYRSLYEQRIKYLIILIIITPFFSFAFNTPAFIATWWFVIFSVWVYFFFTHAIPKKIKKVYLFYLVAFIFLWLGVNFWWLFPFFHIAPTNLFITTNEASSVSNVESVSQYFTMQYALRGISTFYPVVQGDWGSIYLNPFFDLLSFVELGLITVSLFYSKKIKLFGFFLFIFIVSVFVSKGSEDPFGSLIVYAFALIPYLGVFRNPFEKFGVLIPFAQCFLAGYGLYYLLQIKKRGVIVAVTFCMIGFFIYHWPLFTGNVFGNLSYSETVQVPKEYDEVRNWFVNNGSPNPRILHLPLALGDGIIYDWPHGYWGLESSQLFFPGSSISHFVGFPLVDSRYQDLAIAVRNNNKLLFQSLIKKFAINYLVIHKDVDFSMYRTDSLKNIISFVNSSNFLEKKTEIGNLVIYKVKNTPANHINIEQVAYPSAISGDITYYPEILEENNNTQIFNDKSNSVNLTSLASEGDLLPNGIISQFDVSINKDILMQELPFVRFLPGSFFYSLIRFKENFEMIGKDDLGVLLLQLQDSSKRVVETDRLISLSKNTQAAQTLDEYINELHSLSPAYTKKIQSDIQNYSGVELTLLEQILLRQQALLNEMSTGGSPEVKTKLELASNSLQELLYTSGLESRYTKNKSQNLRIYHFTVSHPGDYKIYLSKSWLPFFQNNYEASTLIDGKTNNMPLQNDSDKIFVGPFYLKTGDHEIGFNINTDNEISPIGNTKNDGSPLTVQKTNSDKTIDLKNDNSPVYKDFVINNFNPSYTYLASYDYWTKFGSDPQLSFIQDIDPPAKQKIDLDEVTSKQYQFYWKNESTSHIANLFAHSVKFRITLNPWNNCVDMHKDNKKVCSNPVIYQQFNRPSEASIKNIVFQKFPPNEIYLSEDFSRKEKVINVVSQEINPTKYTLSLHATQNSLIILNETYHDGWQLRDSYGKIVNAPHILVNGYANGWIVSGLKSGNYSISFISQNDKNSGIVGGILCTIIGVIFITLPYKWKNKHI